MSLRDRIKAGEPLLGLLCATGSAQVIELGAWLGIDYVCLDMEHGDGLDMGVVPALIRTADAAGVPTIVRVPAADEAFVHRLLDWGALGICFPHIQTREDAERAVRLCKYPPEGDRSMSTFARSGRYGTHHGWDEQWRSANRETAIIALVEDPVGVSNLDEIAKVPGIDVLWIGRGDLAQKLGVPLDSPELAAPRRQGLDAAVANELAALTPLAPSLGSDREACRRQFQDAYNEGYRMFIWLDTAIFSAAIGELLDLPRPAPA